MISREDIEEFTDGEKFYAVWKRSTKNTIAFYSGKMSDLPVRGKYAEDRFLLEDTNEDGEKYIKATVTISNIIYIMKEEGGEVLENKPLDIEAVA
jgi:hypothetical protein